MKPRHIACHGVWWLPGGSPGACGGPCLFAFENQQLCLKVADVWSLGWRIRLDRWESNITGECFLILSTLSAPICPLARAPRSSPSPSSFSPAPHAPTTPPSPLLAGPPGPGPRPAQALVPGFWAHVPGPALALGFGPRHCPGPGLIAYPGLGPRGPPRPRPCIGPNPVKILLVKPNIPFNSY